MTLAATLARDIVLPSNTHQTPPPPGTRITIYTDASAALAAAGVDMVLLGADRIAASGAVSNKMGVAAGRPQREARLSGREDGGSWPRWRRSHRPETRKTIL